MVLTDADVGKASDTTVSATHPQLDSTPPASSMPPPPVVDTSDAAVERYIDHVMRHLLDTNAGHLPAFLIRGDEPMGVHSFLAIEKMLPDMCDEQHIHNKLVYDAVGEALTQAYADLNRVRVSLSRRARCRMLLLTCTARAPFVCTSVHCTSTTAPSCSTAGVVLSPLAKELGVTSSR